MTGSGASSEFSSLFELRRDCEDRKEGDIALNPDRIGHRYPSYRYEVNREKIREYALVTGAYEESEQQVADNPVAPPTFAACFTLVQGIATLLSDGELGAHQSLLHVSQEYAFHRPVGVGDVLDCTPWIAGITVRRGNEFLTLQIDCLDAGTGEPVVTSRGTVVFLGPGDQ